MGDGIYWRQFEPDDADFVAARIEPEVIKRLEEQCGRSAIEGLRASVSLSMPHAVTVCASLEPIAIMGIMPEREYGRKRVGLIWCVRTPTLLKHYAVEFSKRSRRFLDGLMQHFDIIHNVEHPDNEADLRWLRFCGFEMVGKLHSGPNKVPMNHFARYSEATCLR